MAAVVVRAVPSGDSSSVAGIGLVAVLISLLVGGIVLLGLGIRDVARNFGHFLHARSEKNQHV